MTEYYLLDPEIVKQVEWQGDAETYDSELRALGPIGEPFIAQNPYVSDSRPFYFIDQIPETEQCIVWMYREEWQAKYFPVDWQPSDGYLTLEIQIPQFIWRKNSDLDRSMTFEQDVFGTFKPDSWQAQHELIWYMDPCFNPLDDKVWAISCKPVGKPILGIMDMGYVTPEVEIEYNPDLPKFELDLDSLMPPYWELSNACAYRLDPKYETDNELYVLVIRPRYRNPKFWTWLGIITPQLKYTTNKNLPQLDIEIEENFVWHDLFYEHVWYLDPSFLYPGQEDVWLIKAKAISEVQGSKHHTYVQPRFKIEYNPEIPRVKYDLDLNFKLDDLSYDHIWHLHRDHHPYADQCFWAVKLSFTDNVKGSKHYDDLRPRYSLKINKQLKDIEFEFDPTKIPYFDFVYTNCFYMRNPGNDVLAVEVDFVKKPDGTKHLGYIKPVPKIEYNLDIKNIRFKAEHDITFDERQYLHVWYLNNNNNELIWLAKSHICKKLNGEKTVAYVDAVMPKYLDVFFISYEEPNAEENWQRVLSKAPWAKRVHGIKGIDNAHKVAARSSETDMFYVVDGDAYLVDNFNFDFQPGIFERDYTHIWKSQNPFNDLEYGYGGVKLFPRSRVIKTKKWTTLDFTQALSSGIKVMDQVSNITKFNTDKFSTWRAAFREGVKLYQQGSLDKITTWTTNSRAEFHTYAVKGILDAMEFYQQNRKNKQDLSKINDIEWLRQEFNHRYNND